MPCATTPTSPGLVLGIVVDGQERVYVVDRAGQAVLRLAEGGSARPVTGGLSSPVGLGLAADEWLHVATWGDGSVYRLSP